MNEQLLQQFLQAMNDEETAVLLAGISASPEETARITAKVMPRVQAALAAEKPKRRFPVYWLYTAAACIVVILAGVAFKYFGQVPKPPIIDPAQTSAEPAVTTEPPDYTVTTATAGTGNVTTSVSGSETVPTTASVTTDASSDTGTTPPEQSGDTESGPQSTVTTSGEVPVTTGEGGGSGSTGDQTRSTPTVLTSSSSTSGTSVTTTITSLTSYDLTTPPDWPWDTTRIADTTTMGSWAETTTTTTTWADIT